PLSPSTTHHVSSSRRARTTSRLTRFSPFGGASMGAYIGGRLLQVVPTLLLIVTIVFFLVHIVGDPIGIMLGDNATPEQVATMREAMGLNEPVLVQYFSYLGSVLTGDFGVSYQYNQAALP